MVNLSKSNWATKVLLIVAVMFVVGFLHQPKALSSSDHKEFTKVEEAQTKELTLETLSVKPQPVGETTPIRSESLGLRIDSINLNIPLAKTTLDKNRNLVVPANPNVAAWYKSGPIPGQAGTALITGHLDSAAGPGVFYNLKKVKVGDRIEVKRDDGKLVIYEVNKVASYSQDNSFPWDKVYSTSGESGIRIITCDGVYNARTARYNRNLVVYGALVSVS